MLCLLLVTRDFTSFSETPADVLEEEEVQLPCAETRSAVNVLQHFQGFHLSKGF